LLLVGLFADRVMPTGGLGFILLQGIRFDLILVGIIFGPVLLVKPWLRTSAGLHRFGQWILPVYMGVITALDCGVR
jgi:hypothetical protein